MPGGFYDDSDSYGERSEDLIPDKKGKALLLNPGFKLSSFEKVQMPALVLRSSRVQTSSRHRRAV